MVVEEVFVVDAVEVVAGEKLQCFVSFLPCLDTKKTYSVVRPLEVPKTPPPPPPIAVEVTEPATEVPKPTPAQQPSPAGQEVKSEQHCHELGIQLDPQETELAVHPEMTPLQVCPVGQQPTESQ